MPRPVVGELQPASHVWLFGSLNVALPQNTMAWAGLFWRSGIRRSLSFKNLALKRNFNHCIVDIWLCCHMSLLTTGMELSLSIICSMSVVSKLISPQSQIPTVQWLKFLLRAKFFKLKLLLMPLLQNRLAQAMIFCGRAILKGPKSHMWLLSNILPATGIDQCWIFLCKVSRWF